MENRKDRKPDPPVAFGVALLAAPMDYGVNTRHEATLNASCTQVTLTHVLDTRVASYK